MPENGFSNPYFPIEEQNTGSCLDTGKYGLPKIRILEFFT